MLIFKNKDSELEQKQRKKDQIKHRKLILVVVIELWEMFFSISGFQIFTMSIYGLVKNNYYLQG